MPSTREIRTRIKSLKGTQQITKAMKMVAAAKVRRAQDRVLATRPYAQKLLEMFQFVGQKLGEDIEEPLLEQREVKNVGLLIITSDKGLCGGYNSNMFKFALKQIDALKAEGKTAKAWLVGNKAIGFFRNEEFEILGRYAQIPAIPTYTEAQMLTKAVTEAFINKEVDEVILMYTDFVSMLSYIPTASTLLPVVAPKDAPPVKGEYLFEPDPETILKQILPRYIGRQVLRALLEGATSELASRMTAMDAATKNADDLLEDLTLEYNKVRQAYITKEILEVIGGAEALS